ncbi:MAG: hypothetical protein ACIAQ0_06375 [Phycisphaerales bacterium JB058]
MAKRTNRNKKKGTPSRNASGTTNPNPEAHPESHTTVAPEYLPIESGQYANELYDLYIRYRTQLDDREHNLDKAIATANIGVAGGALAISLTLTSDWQITRTSIAAVCLILSWVFLVIAICSTLACLKLNQHIHSKFRQILDEETAIDLANGLDKAGERQRRLLRLKCLHFLDFFQIAVTISGVATLLVATLIGISTPAQTSGNAHGTQTESSTTDTETIDPNSSERPTFGSKSTTSISPDA